MPLHASASGVVPAHSCVKAPYVVEYRIYGWDVQISLCMQVGKAAPYTKVLENWGLVSEEFAINVSLGIYQDIVSRVSESLLPGFSDIEMIPSSPYRLASSFENKTFA